MSILISKRQKSNYRQEEKLKNLDTVEIDELSNPSDFIRLRAETDSVALKNRFSNEFIHKKNLPSNNSSRSLYNIAEKIRYECLGGKMLKGIEKNFNQNYSQIISLKRKDQLKTKDDVPIVEAFELYMLKNFHHVQLNTLTKKKLSFWEKDFDKSIKEHVDFLNKNLENQNKFCSKISEILQNLSLIHI